MEAIFFQGDGKNFHGVKSSESVLKLRMCATAHESAQKQEQKEVKLRKRNQKWANACQNKTKAHKSVWKQEKLPKENAKALQSWQKCAQAPQNSGKWHTILSFLFAT